MADSRFPRSVYSVGEEPDPRFSLANERTFLAWIRTSLALLAVGVAIEALQLQIQPVLRFIAAVIFVLLAVIAAVHGWMSWMHHERAMRLGRALPAPSTAPIIAVGVVLAALLLAVGLFL
ncbi:DUF202 domain-containing protein [Microbacterium kribbense]|uniref:DUF202 domain-containing protein n=1 Tax=Microbacterium kribbense TaxID=433645 RepID=A0ABP7GQM3_9MICO